MMDKIFAFAVLFVVAILSIAILGIMIVHHKVNKQGKRVIRGTMAVVLMIAIYEIADFFAYSPVALAIGFWNVVIQLFGMFSFVLALAWICKNAYKQNPKVLLLRLLIGGAILGTGIVEMLSAYFPTVFLVHNILILIFVIMAILTITNYLISIRLPLDGMPFYTKIPNTIKKRRGKGVRCA